MSIHLHVFMVSNRLERCIAFEFYTNDQNEAVPAFDIELIVWGMDRDMDLPATVEILMRRGWELDKIEAAISRALKKN